MTIPFTEPEALPVADAVADDATAAVAELVAEVKPAAKILADFTDGATLYVDRIALQGTPKQLDAWRDTRVADARLREQLARWRDAWRKAVRRNISSLTLVEPLGLDLYAWEQPELCDHEDVRHGARVLREHRSRTVTLLHVDVVRVAQQSTVFRLLGPTAALELIGPNGIVQNGHPLRCGDAQRSPNYWPGQPTWLFPQPEPVAPRRTGTRVGA